MRGEDAGCLSLALANVNFHLLPHAGRTVRMLHWPDAAGFFENEATLTTYLAFKSCRLQLLFLFEMDAEMEAALLGNPL